MTRSLFSRAKFYSDPRALNLLMEHGIVRLGVPYERVVLLPVPPHKKRLLRRGFSMADRMAILWSRSWGISYSFGGVERKDGPESKTLDRNERLSIRSGDRWLFRDNLKKDPVVLVDDLVTTGWTLKSLAHGLEERGVLVAGAIGLCMSERFHGGSETGVFHEV
ncbi:MAG: ComF family protein [Leptospirillum sp.]